MQYIFGSFRFVIPRFAERPPFVIAVTAVAVIVLIVIALDFLSKLIRCKAKVDAKVVRLIPNTTDITRNVDKYVPEYSYEYKGEQYTRTAKDFAGGMQYEVGTVVKLRIDPQHPDTFIDLKRELNRKSVPIAVSVIAVIIGIIILR